jgi:hypothetical protein
VSRRALLRIASVTTALFTCGHSMGTFQDRPEGSAAIARVAMKSIHFEMFGSDRTYFDMFFGYGLLIIFVGVFLTILLWRLGDMDAAQARAIVLITAGLQIGFAVVGFRYFFWAPGVFNALSAGCAAVAGLSGGASRRA